MADPSATIFNIQRYSIDDGPGIRTIVFLKGCPLRCLWCCNPESQHPRPEVSHNDKLCVKCGRCAAACPNGAIRMTEGGPEIDREKCVGCGTCAEACIPGAMKRIGDERTVSDVYRIAYKDAQFYKESGGGVTVSGGEPLMHVDFVCELFRRCHADGINTAVETCGMVPREAIERVRPLTDLFLFDIKQMDSETHKRLTGVGNEQILRNLEWLAQQNANILIRLPLIPGMNDSDADMEAVCAKMDSLGLKRAELMPYHNYGMGKYAQLGLEYALTELKKHPQERLKEIHDIFEAHGIECIYIK